MKCQILFSVKNMKTVSVCCLLNLPRKRLKLILSILRVNLSVEDILKYFFIIIFPRKQILTFHANASSGDNLQNQVLTLHANVSSTFLALVDPQ